MENFACWARKNEREGMGLILDDADDDDVEILFDEVFWFKKVGIIISISDIKRSTLICDSVGGNWALILSIWVSVKDSSKTGGRGTLE